MTREVKLIEWIAENTEGHTDICLRENAKEGCLRCQEFYRLLDELLKEREQKTALAFQKHMDELYGIGGFEEDDKKEFDNWYDTFIKEQHGTNAND